MGGSSIQWRFTRASGRHGDALAGAVLNEYSEPYGAAILAVGLLIPYALPRHHGPIKGVPESRVLVFETRAQ